MNLLGNTPNQTSKFGSKNWVETNDDSRRMYNTNSQIKFKTSMLDSSLCDYRTITVTNTATTSAAVKIINKKVIFKNHAPFTDCISGINNTQLANAEDIDVRYCLCII